MLASPSSSAAPPVSPAVSPSLASRQEHGAAAAPLSSFYLGSERSALRALDARDVSLAIWQRRLPPLVQGAVAGWAAQASPFEAALRVSDEDLAALQAPLAQVTDLDARSWLFEDVRSLVRELAERAGVASVKVSLGPVRTDQCRKFHVDHLRMRLVTTYAGPGTEWIANEHVERSVLAHPPSCPCDANQQILRAGGAVRHCEAGDVLLMKGARYGGAEQGAVHRSPPIEQLAITRLVLIVSAEASAASQSAARTSRPGGRAARR